MTSSPPPSGAREPRRDPEVVREPFGRRLLAQLASAFALLGGLVSFVFVATAGIMTVSSAVHRLQAAWLWTGLLLAVAGGVSARRLWRRTGERAVRPRPILASFAVGVGVGAALVGGCSTLILAATTRP